MNCIIVPLTCTFHFFILLSDSHLFLLSRDDVTYSYFQKQQNSYGPSSTSVSITGLNISNSANVTSRISPVARSPITAEDDRRNERVVQGMRLLLVARERILTLAEQRVSPISDLFYFFSCSDILHN